VCVRVCEPARAWFFYVIRTYGLLSYFVLRETIQPAQSYIFMQHSS